MKFVLWLVVNAVALGAAVWLLDGITLTAGTTATSQELTAAHLRIHQALAGLTESPRLIAMSETLYAEIRLALARLDRARRTAGEQAHAHAALLALLEDGRVAEAEAELADHLAGAERSMVESLASLDSPT
jgi:DNA-binding GntR family transcriptional regulator